MTTGYQIKEQDKLHFVTLQVVEWVDIFSRERYRKIIIENLNYCIKNKGLEIYAWVIMSNHIHMLVKSTTDNLSGTIRDFKFIPRSAGCSSIKSK
jgi:REP element-mobilizing transposase RayT